MHEEERPVDPRVAALIAAHYRDITSWDEIVRSECEEDKEDEPEEE